MGNFKNGGQEWQPKDVPEKSLVHDFPIDSTGKAIPYGVYDMSRNEAWVSVGQDHDTPSFAVASIGQWWNKIEHRLFCHITQNWRGKILNSFETIVDLIGNTKTIQGLKVNAKLDKRKYPTGVKISETQMNALSLIRDKFRGDWNYEIRPN